jgi:hypothetical protein
MFQQLPIRPLGFLYLSKKSTSILFSRQKFYMSFATCGDDKRIAFSTFCLCYPTEAVHRVCWYWVFCNQHLEVETSTIAFSQMDWCGIRYDCPSPIYSQPQNAWTWVVHNRKSEQGSKPRHSDESTRSKHRELVDWWGAAPREKCITKESTWEADKYSTDRGSVLCYVVAMRIEDRGIIWLQARGRQTEHTCISHRPRNA